MQVRTGLEVLLNDTKSWSELKGRVGLLCHSASITADYQWGVIPLKERLGDRLSCLFGPQHGFVTDVQDNMVETKDVIHPYFNLKIFSLYSHTRKPTAQMLEQFDTLLVDLQDVGCRIYTYIYTLSYFLQACHNTDKKIIVLDRPNPIDAQTIEGNILDENFKSFVGLHALPIRHAMTMGEMGNWIISHLKLKVNYHVIKMKNYQRSMGFKDTGLPWVLPSPNLPTVEGCYVFPGSVLYEGTNISEGRGTTRSLELIGHPKIEAFSLVEKLNQELKKTPLKGFVLRPIQFRPTFQKHAEVNCGGIHIHPTDLKQFRPWALGQWLMQRLYHHLGPEHFKWKLPPYEYEEKLMPIDIINGTDLIRHWIEKNGDLNELFNLEKIQMPEFINNRARSLLYE